VGAGRDLVRCRGLRLAVAVPKPQQVQHLRRVLHLHLRQARDDHHALGAVLPDGQRLPLRRRWADQVVDLLVVHLEVRDENPPAPLGCPGGASLARPARADPPKDFDQRLRDDARHGRRLALPQGLPVPLRAHHGVRLAGSCGPVGKYLCVGGLGIDVGCGAVYAGTDRHTHTLYVCTNQHHPAAHLNKDPP
jgi:hypothetical protein